MMSNGGHWCISMRRFTLLTPLWQIFIIYMLPCVQLNINIFPLPGLQKKLKYSCIKKYNETQRIVIGSSRMIPRADWLLASLKLLSIAQLLRSATLYRTCVSWIVSCHGVLVGKCLRRLPHVMSLRNFLPNATKVTLAQSLMFPILGYTVASLTDPTEEQLNKLERLENLCIRFIFGLRKYDHESIALSSSG